MATVKCTICDKGVNTTGNNYVYANSIHQHKKCPKSPVQNDQEKKDNLALRDAIKLAIETKKHPRAEWDSATISWQAITQKIKKLKGEGYSDIDQLYALEYSIEKDGGFLGYGRIQTLIKAALQKREQLAEDEKRTAEYELRKKVLVEQAALKEDEPEKIKVASKPTFMDMGDDDLSWL